MTNPATTPAEHPLRKKSPSRSPKSSAFAPRRSPPPSALLDGGATVPFIARYRKEATGGLDDAQLRTLEERLRYLRELEERRAAILESIREQGKLDAALEAAIRAADSKGRLEDIYLPYKPKRRTKAEIAREAGLEPLADAAARRPGRTTRRPPRRGFVDAEKSVADAAAALDGARAILVERFAEDADLIGSLREEMWSRRPARRQGARRQGGGRRQVQPTISISPSRRQAAVAPHPGAVPRREGGGPRSRHRAGASRPPPGAAQPSPVRARIMHRFGIADRGRAGRQVAGRDGALGLAHQDPGPSRHRSADAAVDRRPRRKR